MAIRVLVVGNRFRSLSPEAAGVAIARGVAPQGQAALIPLAAGGPDLGRVLVGQRGGTLDEDDQGWVASGAGWLAVGVTEPPAADPFTAGSAALGRRVRNALRGRDVAELVLDLTGSHAHDAGAGLLAGLGVTADVPLDAGVLELATIRRADLRPAQRLLAGVRVVGVVDQGQADDRLLGLRGITVRQGHSAGIDRATVVAVDDALARFARQIASDAADLPGAGAAGGIGFVVLALGGRVETAAAFSAAEAGLDRILDQADLVMVPTDSFDFFSRGGAVVAEVARRAERAQRPVAVLAHRVEISGREMRTLGVESAHPVADVPDPVEALSAAATRVLGGWTA